MNAATRKARMTHQDAYLNHSEAQYDDDSFEREGLRMIAAALAAKEEQRKKDPWNLPIVLWKTLTREQQKMRSNLREAA